MHAKLPPELMGEVDPNPPTKAYREAIKDIPDLDEVKAMRSLEERIKAAQEGREPGSWAIEDDPKPKLKYVTEILPTTIAGMQKIPIDLGSTPARYKVLNMSISGFPKGTIFKESETDQYYRVLDPDRGIIEEGTPLSFNAGGYIRVPKPVDTWEPNSYIPGATPKEVEDAMNRTIDPPVTLTYKEAREMIQRIIVDSVVDSLVSEKTRLFGEAMDKFTEERDTSV